jgi:hypothetical protein
MPSTTMRSILPPAAALLLLAGCAGNPLPGSRPIYYLPPVSPPSYSAPAFYDAPAPVDPPRYVSRSPASVVEDATASRDPLPINVPLPGVPAGNDCGWYRLCNLPGWRYEN